jgi:lysophospholipase L1-like esterase
MVLLPVGALLVSSCSASEGGYNTSEEITTAATDTPASWNYVALGDSLAVGTGASYQGYVDRYAKYLEADNNAQVNVINLGRNGRTSTELLYALQNDSSWRQTIRAANVITFNIGINDLGHAGEAYENGTCGGDDNQDCLREAVQALKDNWDAITAEILTLRSTSDTVVRTAGLGYIPYIFTDEAPDTTPSNGRLDHLQIFKPYVKEIDSHIAASATDEGIPYAEMYLGEGEISPDGVHPNDEGYEVIAEKLRELGYGPLR